MNVAHILPTNCIDKKMLRQPYEMYLTHKILEHPEIFSFLKEDTVNDIHSYKILDNSACELGEGLNFDKVLQAAEIIGAHEVVLPDIPRSGKSLTCSLSYLLDLDEEVHNKYRIAAVCQGETYEQIIACAEQILSLKAIGTIMIPKWYCSLNSTNGLGRHQLTKDILHLMLDWKRSDVQIHWLGLDTGFRELVTPIAKFVRSVDTGYLAALSTPQWSRLSSIAERPRELKIDLEYMDVNLIDWEDRVIEINKLLQEVQ